MDSSISTYPEWIVSGTVAELNPDSNCPGVASYCWWLDDGAELVHQYTPTTGYSDVRLEYNVRRTGSSSTWDRCVISYRINGSSASTIVAAGPDPVELVNRYYHFPAEGDNNPVGIQITLENAEYFNNHGCYYNNVALVEGPTTAPTDSPSEMPTILPTDNPSTIPSNNPTQTPTENTNSPTKNPSGIPTLNPSTNPTLSPSTNPTASPIPEATPSPSSNPTASPTTTSPSSSPTTTNPSLSPTTTSPSSSTPTAQPVIAMTDNPTVPPTDSKEVTQTDDTNGNRRGNLDSNDKGLSIPMLVGIVLGCVFMVGLIILISFMVLHVKRKKSKTKENIQLSSINSISALVSTTITDSTTKRANSVGFTDRGDGDEDDIDQMYQRNTNHVTPRNNNTDSDEEMYNTKSNYVTTNGMNDDDDDDGDEMYNPNNVITPTNHQKSVGENLEQFNADNDYSSIEKILKKCDEKGWERYLYNFKKHKVNQQTLSYLLYEDINGKMWTDLIPEYGIRLRFRAEFKQNL